MFTNKYQTLRAGLGGKSPAFTLIELLLVVTIIAIIGITSVSGFSRMLELQDADTTMKSIENTIDSLDRDILRYNSVSYDTLFESGSVGFTTNLDAYRKNPHLQYSFNFSAGTGTLSATGSTGTGIIGLHFTTYSTLGKSSSISMSGEIQTFSLPPDIGKKWYKVSGTLSDAPLNSYIIQYYNITNTDNVPEQEVHLIKIEGTLGGTSKNYSSLLVSNTLGQKTLQGSGATLDSLEKATLTFEKNGKEMTLEMTPKK